MDLVYILGTQDAKRSYSDLRYSLRSVEKHIKGYRNIYIVGECPKWVKNIIHIPAKDPFLYKVNREGNMIYKTLRAAEWPDVSDSFILLNDDHYYLNDLHVNDIRDWYKGDLSENKANNPLYQKARHNTFKLLQHFGAPTLDYDGHWPNRFHKNTLRAVMNSIKWQDKHFVFKSLYYNLTLSDAIPLDDCKIDATMSPAQFRGRIKGRHLFSTSEHVTSTVMLDMYFDEFLNKSSKYENEI